MDIHIYIWEEVKQHQVDNNLPSIISTRKLDTFPTVPPKHLYIQGKVTV